MAAFTAGPTAILASMSTLRVKPQRPDLVDKALVPDYGLGAHTAGSDLFFMRAIFFRDTMLGGLCRPTWLMEPQPAVDTKLFLYLLLMGVLPAARGSP